MTPSELLHKTISEFQLTYSAEGVNGPIRQSLNDADRPWCALLNACVQAQNGDKIGGRIGDTGARTLKPSAIRSMVASALTGFERHLAGLNGELVPATIPTPLTLLGYTLDQYQVEPMIKQNAAGVILDFKVGLGKTLTALACAKRYLALTHHTERTHPVVVIVCPLNAFAVWDTPDVRQYLSDAGANDAHVVSADSLHKLQGLHVPPGSVLIVDEAQYFGDPKSERTQHAHALRWRFSHAILLTGSMLTAGPEKVLSLLDLMVPGAATYNNKWALGHAFSSIVAKPIPNTRMVRQEVMRPTRKALVAWNEWLSKWVVSKSKRSADVMSSVMIPDQEVHTVKLGEPEWAGLTDSACECALRVQKADPEGELPSMMAVVHQLARDGLDDKLEWLEEQMAGSTDQVVIFCTYHDSLNGVQARLEETHVTFCRVDGETAGKDRAELIADFTAGKYRVFLAQTDAASVSMNLQCARISVMMDATSKASSYEQAMGRTCRRGSQELCHHFNLLANKFQEKVFDRLAIALDFNASSAEWQDIKASLKGIK